MRKFILGLDEGTTNIRSVLYDASSFEIVDISAENFKQFYPQNGWVEQDANEILRKILKTSKDVLKNGDVKKEELLGIAITNQRETVVAWNRKTGKPICPAIVWQCRRTTKQIDALTKEEKRLIKERTGLIADAYFSASKMKWILDNVKEAKQLAKNGDLCFGTIDSFLIFNLTGNFVTDTTNASRTMLMNIHTLSWDDELLSLFGIDKTSLPKILASDANFGCAKKLFGAPICGVMGDQMSSMIGQGAINVGNTKVTFGTGGFFLTNIGTKSDKNLENMLTTVASTIDGKTEYAIEGSIYSACSAIEWIKTAFNAYENVGDTAKMAKSLKDNEGVYFVPAFSGLGAPYWKSDAKAALTGLTFASGKNHIVRACLESMAYNTKAIVDELRAAGHRFKMISVDGGASKNEFLLQFLADMLNHDIVKSRHSESTVLGCIFVAMLSLKLIKKDDIKKLTQSSKIYSCNMSTSERTKNYDGWKRAVQNL